MIRKRTWVQRRNALLGQMQKGRIFIFVIAVIAVIFVAVWFIAKKKPHVPSLPVVGVCKPLRTGLRRLGNSGELQFDISVQDFRVMEGSADAPPFLHGFTLTPTAGRSKLTISFGKEEFP